MKSPESNLEDKRRAAQCAAALVESGMTVGLGSGSTAEQFVRALGVRVAAGLRVRGVASSGRTEAVARQVGVPLVDLTGPLDLAVDGADTIERGTLNAVKGLGGALTREKLVALAAQTFVLVGDASKLVDHIGMRRAELPVPIEVLAFGWQMTQRRLSVLGQPLPRRRDDALFTTDNGNIILDLYGADVSRAADLAAAISGTPGVIEHGLFLDIASRAIVAGPGGVLDLRRG